MRLTLRTMLAYLDGILDPKDAEDIGKKIEESEYATGLLHRIRDVVRRMRLAAPAIGDRTAGLDANNVAEYLDNTLPSEGVTDFEKVCLESDVHLAEVASCHQILTLVLGEPAEIDAASRQRMYQLKDEPEDRRAAEASMAPPDKPPTLPARETALSLLSTVTTLDLSDEDGEPGRRRHRAKPTVPEYLREPRSRRRWLPAAAALLLIACLTVVVLKTLGQFEPDAPLGRMMVRWGVVAPPATELAVDTQTAPGRVETQEAPTTEPLPTPPQPQTTETAKAPDKESAIEPGKDASEGSGDGREPAAPSETPRAAVEPPRDTPNEPAPATAIVTEPAPPTNLPPPPDLSGSAAAESGKVATNVAAESQPMPDASKTFTADTAADRRGPGQPGAADANPLPPEPIGRLVTSDQILLRDDGADGWRRVGATELLVPGRFMSLPTYRPRLTLSAGITLEIVGGTLIELLPSDSQNPLGIRILYGRVGMLPLAQAGAHVKVVFGSRAGVVAFGDADSVAAFDVRRLHPPGANPEEEPPHIVADLYSATGSITWSEADAEPEAKPLRLQAPQWMSFNAALTSAPATSKELPPWLIADPISQLEKRASVAIGHLQAVPTDRPARLALMELSASRPQKEVRALALRCLAHIGQFGDMAKALNDPARKLDWPEYVDELRDAVARDAQSAAAVRQALEQQYPDQAATLYRMLWGYSNRDLEGGEDARLVRDMNDDVLAVRRLSFWNLKDLTGVGVYQPEQSAAKRQPSLRRWQQRLDAREIRVKTPEERAGAAATEGAMPVLPPAGP